MTPDNFKEYQLLQRRIEYLKATDRLSIWLDQKEELPPWLLRQEFDDINTRDKLMQNLAALEH